MQSNGTSVSKNELVQQYVNLSKEFERWESYLRRKDAPPKQSTSDQTPSGDTNSKAHSFADNMADFALTHPHRMSWYLEEIADRQRDLEHLKIYAARRAGDPMKNDRYQNQSEWQQRADGKSLPQKYGEFRNQARKYLDQRGYGFYFTLWHIASNVLMSHEFGLTWEKAKQIKDAVSREYQRQRNESPPKVPRGWWHPKQNLQPTLGGLQPVAIELEPWLLEDTPPQDRLGISPTMCIKIADQNADQIGDIA